MGRILRIIAAQKEKKVTVKTTIGDLILKQFGEEIISVNPPNGLRKSDSLYITLKRECKNSPYFSEPGEYRSGFQRNDITQRLKMFLGRELKTI